jgi:hypothetical protein
MRLTLPALTLLLPMILLASCTDSGQVTAPAETHKPNFDPGAHTPTSPGPIVERPGFPAALFMSEDPATSLSLIAGADVSIEQACADPQNLVAPGISQAVFPPPGGVHFIYTGEVTVQVFQVTGDAPQGFCDLVGEPLVASGTATFRARVSATARGTLALHVDVEGVLDLTSGGQVRLSALGQTVFRPSDGALVLDRSRITLTPL